MDHRTHTFRAAFVLRQAFDMDYADLAAALGKSEAACRQLVHRATERVQAERPHFADGEIAELTFSIAQINAWNRLGVGMRLPVARKPLKA